MGLRSWYEDHVLPRLVTKILVLHNRDAEGEQVTEERFEHAWRELCQVDQVHECLAKLVRVSGVLDGRQYVQDVRDEGVVFLLRLFVDVSEKRSECLNGSKADLIIISTRLGVSLGYIKRTNLNDVSSSIYKWLEYAP